MDILIGAAIALLIIVAVRTRLAGEPIRDALRSTVPPVAAVALGGFLAQQVMRSDPAAGSWLLPVALLIMGASVLVSVVTKLRREG